MKTITLTYEVKTAYGNWVKREYDVKDREDYERVMNIMVQNKEDYRLIDFEINDNE